MDMQDSLVQFEQSLQSLDDDIKKLRNDFVRLRKTAEHELESCLQSTTDPFKEYCQKAKQMLDDHGDLPMDEVQDAGFAQTRKDLKAIAEYNISGLLHDARTKFSKLETSFQQEIGRKQNLVRDRLKEIGDELFQVAETISDRIKKVNFDELYHYISLHLETSDGYPVYKNYLWIAGLSVSGVMALMALAFGFGLFYGCCGKRPSYYEDDCCVRTTGSKLYCCGIALGIMVLFAMMVIGVVLFLAGANARSILCEPLDDPLRRPDAVALMERYLDVWKAKHGRDDVTLLLDEHNLTDIIRGCAQNRTLYDIFDLDKKYHLNDLKKQKEEAYRQLDEYLESMLRDLRVRDTIGDLITPEITNKLKKLNEGNITGIPLRLIRTIEDQIDKLDLLKNSQQLIDVEKLPEQRAVEVRRVLNDVRKLEEESATPLRRGLAQLVGNLTELNSRLPNLTERIPSLLIRLQHAEALLASNLTGHVEDASSEISAKLKSYVDGY
uniref:Uncharacterized protein n=1 Tax=Plectus sambesii TaxID=2011161 RepID=A0A914USE2_9BILA